MTEATAINIIATASPVLSFFSVRNLRWPNMAKERNSLTKCNYSGDDSFGRIRLVIYL